MFITENQSLTDSILFLGSARQALKYTIQESSIKSKDELISFIMNEASDYEIMNLLVRGELPKEKYNHTEELLLFSELKSQIINDIDVISEHFGFGVVKDFINHVDSIYPNYSSAVPVLEHLVNQKKALKEGLGDDIVKGITVMTKGFGTAAKEVGDVAKSPETRASVDALKKMLKVSYDANKKLWEAGKEKVAVMKLANKYNISTANAQKVIDFQKKWGDKPMEVIKNLSGAAGKAVAGAAGEAGKAVAGAAKDVAGAAQKGSEAMGKGIVKGVEKGKELIDKAKGLDQEKVVGMLKQKAQGAGDAMRKAMSDPKIVGGVAASALGALALYASVKAFKRYMTKAGKACAGQKGAAKKDCYKNFKIKAVQAQIADLNKALAGCAKAKKPDKCKAPIAKKIASLQRKMQAMS